MKALYVLTIALALALTACDGASSKSTGPTFNCIQKQAPGGTGDKTASSGVGDSVQNCTNRPSDDHSVQNAPAA